MIFKGKTLYIIFHPYAIRVTIARCVLQSVECPNGCEHLVSSKSSSVYYRHTERQLRFSGAMRLNVWIFAKWSDFMILVHQFLHFINIHLTRIFNQNRIFYEWQHTNLLNLEVIPARFFLFYSKNDKKLNGIRHSTYVKTYASENCNDSAHVWCRFKKDI